MLFRWKAIVLLIAASAVLAAAPAWGNEKAEPDPAQSPYWETIRKIMLAIARSRTARTS